MFPMFNRYNHSLWFRYPRIAFMFTLGNNCDSIDSRFYFTLFLVLFCGTALGLLSSTISFSFIILYAISEIMGYTL